MSRIDSAVNIDDLKRMAKRRLPKIMYDFIEGGVEDEVGLRTNANAFRDIRLVPRYYVDTSKREQRAKLFDRSYASPFGIAPTGMAGAFRRDAELFLAQAAADADIPYLMSGAANASMEAGAKLAGKNLWYQIYGARDRAVAHTIIPDFDGVELAILVGGTSRLPFVREIVASVVPGAKVLSHDYLDEMLATVRGVGFSKDFADLVVLRPPYETRIRVTLKSGSTHTLILNEAFECFPRRQFFQTAVPIIQKRGDYASPIDTVRVTFVSPTGKYIDVAEEELDPVLFRGCRELDAQLNIHASLGLRSGGLSRSLRAPYFTQVGLLPPKPFNTSALNAPDVYPDDN